MSNIKDLTGFRQGRLTVLSIANGSEGGSRLWNCVCDCGRKRQISSRRINAGQLSCGCLQGTNHGKHHMTYTVEHQTWANMLTRCYNRNSKDFPRYGGRGIVVCERWRTSFTNFYADMGKRPGDWHSLDRINNDGNYEPSNCRWATPEQQAANRGGVYAVR